MNYEPYEAKERARNMPEPSSENSNRIPPQKRSYSQDSHNMNAKYQEQGYMSNYGSRLMRPMPGKQQDTVYTRQQKPYNIISCYPQANPAVHRKYPKLTLEDKLIETGHYGYNPEGY